MHRCVCVWLCVFSILFTTANKKPPSGQLGCLRAEDDCRVFFSFLCGAEGGAIKAAFETTTPRPERLIIQMQSRAPWALTATRGPGLIQAHWPPQRPPLSAGVTVTHLIQFRGWNHDSGCDRAVSLSNVTDFSLLATELMTQWAHRSRSEEVQYSFWSWKIQPG